MGQTRRVGIGMTAPLTDLDVIGDTMGIRSTVSTGWDNLWFHVDGASANITASGAENGLKFRVGANAIGNYGNGQSLNTVMTLLPNGRLGLGTTAPFSQFSNTTKNTIGNDGNGGNPGSFSWSANQGGYAAQIYNESSGNSANGLAVKVQSDVANAFDVSSGAQEAIGNPLFTVRSYGRVGFFTDNPLAPIDVIGGNNKLIMRMTGGRGQADCDGILVLQDSSSNTASNGNNEMLTFANAAFNIIGTVTHVANANSVAYNTTSDARLKSDIHTTRYGLKDLMAIEVDDYKYKGIANAASQTGFLAQQLYTIYPEAVTKGDDTDEKKPYMVDYGKLTPLLVKAMQEMNAQVQTLQEQVKTLQQALDASKKAGGK